MNHLMLALTLKVLEIPPFSVEKRRATMRYVMVFLLMTTCASVLFQISLSESTIAGAAA